MKKALYLTCIITAVAVFSSFTEGGESVNPKTTCDATNQKSCKIVYPDQTTVNATGEAKTVTDY